MRERYNRKYGNLSLGPGTGDRSGEEIPVLISSGYRSEQVNMKCGGAKGSNHLTGCAVDIRCLGPEQMIRYACAGLDVPAHQSGPVDPKRHISKQGNVHIRTALYFPAIVSTQYNPQMKDFYARLCKKNPQSRMVGVTAIMRKLLLLIYSLWKSGEKYDQEREKPVCSRKKKEAEPIGVQPHGIDVGTVAEE